MQLQDPDQALWRRAQHRDEAAFAELRAKYRRVVLNAIRNQSFRGIRQVDLEDLEQRVWIEVWTSLPGFRASSTFLTWLFGLTRNVIFDWIRRKKSEISIDEAVVFDTRGDSGRQHDSTFNAVMVQEALKNLCKNERDVNYLRYFVQLTDQEIAMQLGLPLGTVKSRLRAGLAKLRAGLVGIEGETGSHEEE